MFIYKFGQVVVIIGVIFLVGWVVRMRRAVGRGLCPKCGEIKQRVSSSFCAHCGEKF